MYIGTLVEVMNEATGLARIEKIFKIKLPKNVKELINNPKRKFINSSIRILSLEEIINSQKELGVNFKSMNIIPLADCGDNNFIVYNYNTGEFAKFNIIDKTLYKRQKDLTSLISESFSVPELQSKFQKIKKNIIKAQSKVYQKLPWYDPKLDPAKNPNLVYVPVMM